MGLFNSLIALLAIKILFLKVNAISLDHDPPLSQLELKKDDALKIFNNSRCNESRNVSRLVPYTETYRYKPEHAMPGEPYQIKTRSNYKKEFHTELTCCEGYVQSGAMCVPRCPQSCQNGTCKEPDVCTCNTGYRMSSNGSCVSQCTNDCVNGTCVDPGICNCNEGYLLNSDGFTCRPVCPAQCEETHGYCTEPNVCTCPSGYRQHERFYHVFKFMCEPVCFPECENGLCVAPNVCKCADGYEKDEDDSFICNPKCGDSCAFGTCIRPGYCICNPGYIKKYHAPNGTVCEPNCWESCKMGKCVAPRTCSCNEGYRLRNNSKYIYNEHICEPICENDMCGGGICVAPGTCLHENQTVSNTSVVLSNSTQSKPICTIPCGPNGECTSPNECTCFKGYRSHAHIIITELHENFSKTPFPELSEKHICQPVCNFKCYNGKCTAPNVCTCDPGYYPEWLEDSDFKGMANFCHRRIGPPCNALSCGNNGTCHESGICVCDDGYRKDTAGACIPICNRGCLDGMCTAPDHCACREGYALQNGKFGQNVCKAICERGCENGKCVGPNECICNNGFIPNIDHHSRPECIPVCTRNCSGHGDCIISTNRDHYRCECHFGWTGLDCDQPSLCVIKMAYEKVKKRGMLYFANSTIKRAYEDAPYCSQCYDSLDNKTVCYVMENYEHNLTVSCFLNTDLPCYAMSRYDASSNVTIIVWPFVILAILLVIGLTVAAYFIYRQHQKKKLATANISTNNLVRESPATEILLPDI